MRPITRRTALASTAALASVAAITSCGGGEDSKTQEKIETLDDNVNAEDYPIVDEEVTISLLSARPPTTAETWDDVAAVKQTQELTNVTVDFGLVPQDGAAERRNLSLTSGDYAEAFYRTGVPSGDIAKYGEQGTFIPLNDLLEKYMPNLTAIMEDNPTIREGLTFPDGNIYSAPQIYDPEFLGMRYMFKIWARKDWLDKFGMDSPETLDEYEAYLEESVGSIDGAIGIADASKLNDFMPCLYGTFGVGNMGTAAGKIDLDPQSGKVRYFSVAEEYREYLEYLNRLYSKGLILKDIFASDRAKFNTYGTDGLLASCATQTPEGFFGKEGKNYVPLRPLVKNSEDEPVWHAVRSEVASIGQFIMTDKCEHPVALARWMDYWYSAEGAKTFFLGKEGESYEDVDGRLELLPEITEGQSIDDGLKPYALYMGGSYPGWAKDEWFRGVENLPQAVEGSKLVKEFSIDEVWPAFTFTSEESDMLSSIGNDIGKFADEARDGFITGQKPMSEWDDYVATFEQIGLSEYMAAHQAAYDRRG
ncbi:MAG: extracellular solute-binding protein [Dermabacteraceae bacterium]